ALTKLADFAALGVINKLLGALFGGVKIAFIISVFLLIFNALNQTIPLVSDDEIKSSLFFNPVKSLAPRVLPKLVKTANQVDTPTSLSF
ncbi:MAG: CvpA family protein, partial [Flavobacteriaceae bacterium]|nr:CvpA family protein [Flavobacteriaceae bacterium]